MTSSNPTPADDFNNWADDGEQQLNEQLAEQGGCAARAIKRLFAKVRAGKLEATVLEQLADWADNPNQGVPTSQQQPAQLGSSQGGSQPSTSDQQITSQQALQVLAQDQRVSQGMRMVIQRMNLPANAGGVEFDNNGDDVRIAELRQQLSDVENERNTLRDERNAARQECDNAQQAVADARTGWTENSVIQPLTSAIRTEFGGLSTSLMSSSIDNEEELGDAITALEQAVS